MIKSKLISVDPGKYATKAVALNRNNQIEKVYFRTKIFRLNNNIELEAQGKSFNVNLEGENYIIGDQGEEIDYTVDKANINHKLATYTAATQLLEDCKAIKLVIGCPTSIYRNKNLRDEYKNYIWNNGRVRVVVNDKSYSFLIENVLVLPEGSGIVYTKPELFKDKRVAVIDLGGLNMNFTIYDNLVPQPSSMFTINHGYAEIETKLTNELNSMYGTSFTSNDIQNIVRQGGVKVRGAIDPKSSHVIDSIIEQYMVKLVQETRKNNVNLDMMDVVFVGGTSLLIHDKILHHLPHATIMNNALWANVEGFYKIGAIKYERK
jgi:plasmid segregation protein ParM